jgi:hypothetical protein
MPFTEPLNAVQFSATGFVILQAGTLVKNNLSE